MLATFNHDARWFFSRLKHTITHSFTLKGRASSSEVLVFLITLKILEFTLGFLPSFSNAILENIYLYTLLSIPLRITPIITSNFFGGLLAFFAIIPLCSLYIRRLHDYNESGWLFLGYPVPIILYNLFVTMGYYYLFSDLVISTIPFDDISKSAITLLKTFLHILLLLPQIIWLLPGSKGKNSYGGAPKYH